MAPSDAPSARDVRPEILAVSSVQAMDRTEDCVAVRQSFQHFVETLGFSSVWCTSLPVSAEHDADAVLMRTHPATWAEDYFARDYPKHDPILREIIHSRRSFDWSAVVKGRRLSRREREVLHHAAECGMLSGIVVPIHEAGGNIGFVSIAGPGPCTDENKRSALTLVSIFVYHKLRALAAARTSAAKRLSPREIEVLRWIKEGKSDWQIGRILAISAKTVNYHTENAKRKFGVATRMQAVVTAIQRGELPQ